jgi:hypothetical protein
MPSDDTSTESRVSGVPGVPLNHEARILRAPLLKNEDTGEGALFRVAAITDFPNVGFMHMPTRSIHVSDSLKLARKYALQPYDVLVTIVGTIGAVAIVPPDFPKDPEGSEGWVPATNMLAVRFREEAEKKAIAFAVYMKSRHGKRIVEELTHGTTIPLVSKKEFSRRLIPYLSPEVCDESMTIFYREVELEEQREKLSAEIERLREGFLANTTVYPLVSS